MCLTPWGVGDGTVPILQLRTWGLRDFKIHFQVHSVSTRFRFLKFLSLSVLPFVPYFPVFLVLQTPASISSELHCHSSWPGP